MYYIPYIATEHYSNIWNVVHTIGLISLALLFICANGSKNKVLSMFAGIIAIVVAFPLAVAIYHDQSNLAYLGAIAGMFLGAGGIIYKVTNKK